MIHTGTSESLENRPFGGELSEDSKLTALDHNRAGASLTNYTSTYDGLDRITSTSSADGTTDYVYDSYGQLTCADFSYQTDEPFYYDGTARRLLRRVSEHQRHPTHRDRDRNADEEPFFVHGPGAKGLFGKDANAALAICYESSILQHAVDAFNNGAKVYIASVAKDVGGIDTALIRLSEIAREYSMTVVMANGVELSDGCELAGKTSVCNDKGEVLMQLDDACEGIIVVDTETHDVVDRTIAANSG